MANRIHIAKTMIKCYKHEACVIGLCMVAWAWMITSAGNFGGHAQQSEQNTRYVLRYLQTGLNEGTLSLSLRDENNIPIAGAKILARATHPASGEALDHILLNEMAKGRYTTMLHLPNAGEWDVQVTLEGAPGIKNLQKTIVLSEPKH